MNKKIKIKEPKHAGMNLLKLMGRWDTMTIDERIECYEYELLYWIIGPTHKRELRISHINPWIEHESR